MLPTLLLDSPIVSIAHVIQLAVAPVFLLSGVGAILNVLSGRLARVVDRARKLETEHRSASGDCAADLAEALRHLAERARLVYRAIGLCTACAILICADIVVLFVGALLGTRLAVPIAVLFVLAMLLLIAGLVDFLREVYLATRSLRIGAAVSDRERLSGT